jgi:hypothetical protein
VHNPKEPPEEPKETWICNNCGFENDEDDVLCKNSGASRDGDDQIGDYAGANEADFGGDPLLDDDQGLM